MSALSSKENAASPTAPPTDPVQRREATSQALLQILTKGNTASTSHSSSPTSSSLTSDFRELLADFIEICNHEIAQLQHRVAALEFLQHRAYRTHEHDYLRLRIVE